MIVDCDTCAVRGLACHDCVVTFLLGPDERLAVEGLPEAEATALAVLADSGLVPPLRLVQREQAEPGEQREHGLPGDRPAPGTWAAG